MHQPTVATHRWYEQLKDTYPRPFPSDIWFLLNVRDRGTCQLCEAQAHSVHHIIPYMYGLINGMGEYINAYSNLISLCNSCHDYIHRFDDNFTHAQKIAKYRTRRFVHDTQYDKEMLAIALARTKEAKHQRRKQQRYCTASQNTALHV